MASDLDDFEQNIENIKSTVRKSFAQIYASLKARELKTLRQLDAIQKQCEDNKDLQRNCVQNINICYKNESSLLDYINYYGVIDFERLSFDSSAFTLEDYISPNDDHMYSYKTIEEITVEEDLGDLEAIEEAALKQITETQDCVCYVEVQPEEVSKKFRDLDSKINIISVSNSSHENYENVSKETECEENNTLVEEKIENSDADLKKINPTDDWLNSIKSQTETEPSQANDVMEHSTITCS